MAYWNQSESSKIHILIYCQFRCCCCFWSHRKEPPPSPQSEWNNLARNLGQDMTTMVNINNGGESRMGEVVVEEFPILKKSIPTTGFRRKIKFLVRFTSSCTLVVILDYIFIFSPPSLCMPACPPLVKGSKRRDTQKMLHLVIAC